MTTPQKNLEALTRPLAELHGVGPERLAQLDRLHLQTIDDLFKHRPHRYEDRKNMRSIIDLHVGETATIHGKVVALGLKRYAHGRKSVFEIIVEDGSARLHCRWWNLPYMQNYFEQGNEVLLHGKLLSLKPRTMDHPESEVIDENGDASVHLNRIVPIYPLTEGLSQRWLRSFIWRTIEQCSDAIQEPVYSKLLPNLPSRQEAFRSLHFPAEEKDWEIARRRLALDEFIDLQLLIQKRRQNLFRHAEGQACPGDHNRLIKPFLARLGFSLTPGQTKVLREIRRDMSSGRPMRRLLQGDVGSGKTVVSGCCALLAMEGGFNVVLMAPTELLAEQHFQTFSRWFAPLGVSVYQQTGNCKSVVPARGSLVIGTHALIDSSFSMEHIGLVIIDEQHRFGVVQRETLVRKGHYPHLLLMTATPIPRTLGLTLYGDLDISIIDELPSGRPSIRTFVRTAESLPKVWAFLRSKLAEGRQLFVVFPRVEDTTQGNKAVTKEFEILQQQLAPHNVALLHGRLSVEERHSIMERFRANSVQVLLSTSLIEVGIDVPNATLMLIENAEQFGLAQLHQLRGRIGRGIHESFCILVNRSQTPEAKQRLDIIEETNDGFKIADADLKLRGPGELLGQQQSGLPPFRFAELDRDLPLIEQAREIAARLLKAESGQARNLPDHTRIDT